MMDEQTKRREALADLLREEFYETLDDAAGAGESYDYDALAERILALVDQPRPS